MKETITSFVGLDVHKDSIAIAVAEAGRQAPRFIGTVVPRLASLHKALRALGRASRTLRQVGWFEVVETRGHVEDGKVAHYQVALKVGFTLDDDD